MIKFFRHIRQMLINKNKIGKYLLYAIGEILLVVTGILIALQINNRNEFKKERLEEQKILRQLASEYQANLEQLDQKIAMRNEMNRASEYLIDLFENNRSFNADSVLYGLFRVTQDPTFDPISNDLVASGKIRLIQNDSLSNLLSNWPSNVYQVQEEELGWQRIREDIIVPFHIKTGIMRDIGSQVINKGYQPDYAIQKDAQINYTIKPRNSDIKLLVKDYELEIDGFASACILYTNIINLQAEGLRNQILTIQKLIDQEINENP